MKSCPITTPKQTTASIYKKKAFTYEFLSFAGIIWCLLWLINVTHKVLINKRGDWSHVRMFETTSQFIIRIAIEVLNKVDIECVHPPVWKFAWVTSILKKSNHDDPNNVGNITGSSTLWKFWKKLIISFYIIYSVVSGKRKIETWMWMFR